MLGHFWMAAPRPGPAIPHEGKPVMRVITMNCALFEHGNPIPDLAVWAPDIVLLQDVYPAQVGMLASALYGGHGDSCSHDTNGIITRWKIQREVPHPTLRDQQVTICLPDTTAVEVVNVHLVSAATDLRFWRRVTWRDHRINLALRLDELSIVQQILGRTTSFPNTPTLFGGDFNSPATDVVDDLVQARGLIDAFAAAGTGWGDTYHCQLPVLRIDRLYATRHFTPVRSIAVPIHSDHRMVVTDFAISWGQSPQ